MGDGDGGGHEKGVNPMSDTRAIDSGLGRPPSDRRKVWVISYKEQAGNRNVSSKTKVNLQATTAVNFAEKHREAGTLLFFGEYRLERDLT